MARSLDLMVVMMALLMLCSIGGVLGQGPVDDDDAIRMFVFL